MFRNGRRLESSDIAALAQAEQNDGSFESMLEITHASDQSVKSEKS